MSEEADFHNGQSSPVYCFLLNLSSLRSTGEYDALPEQAFYMVGPIEEVIEKAARLAEEHGS